MTNRATVRRGNEAASASLREAVNDAYRLSARQLRPHPGGFASHGWVADDTWFVKVWEQGQSPERLHLLVELQRAGLPVPPPLRTRDGELSAGWQGRAFAVFPYVVGRAAGPGDEGTTARALTRVHEVRGIDLPALTWAEPQIEPLRTLLDHPWLRDRRSIVAAGLERFDDARERAAGTEVTQVVCHRDFGGSNLLLADSCAVAMLDWEQAVLGPREHDLWIAAEGGDGAGFLATYGARDLALPHLEYALLARALRDMAARVVREVDRAGVEEWGFRRLAKLDGDLDAFRPYCQPG